MNLSIVLSTQPAAFDALAYQGDLERNIAKIADMGYDGVELAVRDPSLLDVKALEKVMAANGLVVPAIGTGQAYGEDGLSLTNVNDDIRHLAVERLKAHSGLAARFGAVVIIGLIRGRAGDKATQRQSLDRLVEGLGQVARQDSSVKFAIEPINRYETDLINTVASGLELVDKIGLANVGLLLDTFHMNIEESSIPDSIRNARQRLFHFHVADSNRRHPGAGHIDFAEIVDSLDSIGYEGFISAEISPLPDPDTAAAKAIEHFRGIAIKT